MVGEALSQRRIGDKSFEVLAFHPGSNGKHELYLVCDDVYAAIDKLRLKSVLCAPVSDEGWGLLTRVSLPSGGEIGLYQPRHPVAIGDSSTNSSRSE